MTGRPADTIDEVVERLSEIVEWSRAANSRLGYFAALYSKVTVTVGEGIADGFFDDGDRMERLDVIFANRYLEAFEAHRGGRPTTGPWAYAFRVADQSWPIVLQHLLLGMNAHINLDLGIAAARTVPPEELPDLRGDFDKINEVLASLVGGVQEELAQVWMVLRLMNRYLGGAEDAIINFSMEKARDHAWSVATRLALLTEADQARAIDELDSKIVALAHLIRHPGIVGGTVTKVIRIGERGSIPRIIDILR